MWPKGLRTYWTKSIASFLVPQRLILFLDHANFTVFSKCLVQRWMVWSLSCWPVFTLPCPCHPKSSVTWAERVSPGSVWVTRETVLTRYTSSNHAPWRAVAVYGDLYPHREGDEAVLRWTCQALYEIPVKKSFEKVLHVLTTFRASIKDFLA